MTKTVVVLVLMLLAHAAFAQQAKAEIDSLGWLAGCWEGNYGDRIVSEQWMKPLGKTMLSAGRTVKNGKTVAYEFVRLVQEGDGSIVYITHPSGQKEASFKLVRCEGKKVVFENLQHDYPQRVIYSMIAADSLVGRIKGRINGKEESVDFPYRGVKCD